MFVLGLVKVIIIDSVKNGRIYFDMYGFLINVIFVDFNFLVFFFFLGWVFWVVS